MIRQYAPVIIPTMNRFYHFKKCIETLQCNTHAIDTDLIISLDFPPDSTYHEGYGKIKTYLQRGICGFKSVTIIEQETNLGAYRNWIYLRDYVKCRYPVFIFSEDDNEFSPNFLDYINKGLELYKEDESIFAICSNGILPIMDYQYNVALTRNFSARGYATWVEKESKIANEVTRRNFINIAKSIVNLKKLFLFDKSLFYALQSSILRKGKLYQLSNNEIPYIDMTIKIYVFNRDKYVIAPILPTSRNRGYDGSGVNCPKTEDNNENVVIDEAKEFHYIAEREKLAVHKCKNCLYVEDLFRFIGGVLKIQHQLNKEKETV